MKQSYRLTYRTGWGENCEVSFQTRDIITAMEMAKNYCKQNFISVAWLHSASGRKYMI